MFPSRTFVFAGIRASGKCDQKDQKCQEPAAYKLMLASV